MTKTTVNLTRIVARAVKKAQEENTRKGIPNVYCINGKIVYQLPDGTITEKSPFENNKI